MTQVLRTKKKTKAMIRISPSKPPPMYMEFPFINNCEAAFNHEDECCVHAIPHISAIPHIRLCGIYLEG